MRFSPILTASLIGLSLAGVGCSTKPITNIQAVAYAPTYEPTGLATRLYHETWNDGETERCVYELAYPQLEPSYAQADEEYARWDAINRTIQDAAFAGYVATTTEGEYDIQASGLRYIAQCKNEIQELLKSEGNEDSASMSYVQSLGFTTQLFQDGLLSLTFQGYSYTGGAHGLPMMTGLTLALPDGQPLALGDFIKPDSLQPFMQRVRDDLIKEWGDSLFEDANPTVKNFYLTPTGFVFYWNVYEIAPYAAGQQTVFVPFKDVRDQMISDSPVTRLRF